MTPNFPLQLKYWDNILYWKKRYLTTKISFISNKHSLKRKISRVSLDVLKAQGFSLEKENDNGIKNLKLIFGKSEEEY